MTKAPALFVSHGAPTFALEPGVLGPKLTQIGRTLPDLRAVLVVSPHWQTDGAIRVTTTARPETIHDFGGFAPELHELEYPVAGAPDMAERAIDLLRESGYQVAADEIRGLDHGAWVPLLHLLPEAKFPVFQVSLPREFDTRGALRLGEVLIPLRDLGVAIVGSGSMTHNLREYFSNATDTEYARDFAQWVRAAVVARDLQLLLDYRALHPDAQRAHPTEEHFLPLLIAIAASAGDDVVAVDGGIDPGGLSMDSYLWSEPK